MTLYRRATTAVVGALALVVATSFAPLLGQPRGKEDAALKVAEHLDKIVQPRFQKDAGVLGMDRIVTVQGHTKIARFKAADAAESQALSKANSYGRDYVIAFLHMTHVPGKYNNRADNRPVLVEVKPFLTALAVREGTSMEDFDGAKFVRAQAVSELVLDHLPILRAGKEAQAPFEKWLVVMRPVRALQASCISCHTGAKQGDTLGVMVYAVDKVSSVAKK